MQPKRRTAYIYWVYFALVTVLAVYLRFWFVASIPTEQLYDFNTYQEIAANIFKYHSHSLWGQPVAWQGMGYSTALGIFYILMGNAQVQTAQLFNCLLSTLSLPLMFLVFRKLSSHFGVVLGAYTIAALLPNHIAYNNVVGTEVFITFLFLIILVLQLYEFDNRFRYPLLGIFIGLAALTKPFFLAYPVVLALCHWLHSKDLRRTALMLISTSLLMAAVVSPWTIHNYKNFNSFIPVSYNSGYVLFINNNDQNVNGMWMPLENVPASPQLKKDIKRELNRNQDNVKLAPGLDKVLKPAAKQWIGENPGDFMKLGLLRLKQTFFSGAQDISAWAMNDFQSNPGQKESPRFKRNLNFFYGAADILVYILCSAGILYLLLNLGSIFKSLFSRDLTLSNAILVPSINTAFFLAVYFVFEGQPRYNFPLLFLFAITLGIIMHKTSQGLQRSES
ncbi:ArnT family glycosyltransferase [Syntrophomonas zehnderi]|uniref:ArnT family glycosyltransferase n=1 Tax=Syntrophomonas zehnderi TaxID=404335 RepID=UPI000697D04F|nr:glycosyltransferase family 39 protein [Syntrophomonas zehnderi]